MGRIFSGVECVLVWLGLASEDSHIAFDALTRAGQKVETETDDCGDWHLFYAMTEDAAFEQSMMKVLNRPILEARLDRAGAVPRLARPPRGWFSDRRLAHDGNVLRYFGRE